MDRKKNILDIMSNLKIIRSFWGNSEKIFNEISKNPMFENEIVYVWGTINYNKLIQRGYECVLMNESDYDIRYTSGYNHFMHKLEALLKASVDYERYLYLDWDIFLSKKIDIDFFYSLEGKKMSIPLYAYSENYFEGICDFLDKTKGVEWKEKDSKQYDWIVKHNYFIKKYSWKLDGMYIMPNFCFFYSHNSNIESKLIEIYNLKKIETCIEEFCLFYLIDNSLDFNSDIDKINWYINNIEPTSIQGRPDGINHFYTESNTITIFNNYVRKIKSKDIYLVHL